MTQTFPAQPGTYAISVKDGHIIRRPVIAWQLDAQKVSGAPYAMTTKGLTSSTNAILHPCGMVSDPDHVIPFGSLEEWQNAAKPTKKTKVEDPEEPEIEEESDGDEEPSGSSGELQIEWTTKPFKTNSFYRYDDGENEFIFQVDGGNNPPKQKGAVTKIKRDDFMALKKELDVASYDDLIEGRYPGMEDLGDFGESDEDEDEDDGSDLI